MNERMGHPDRFRSPWAAPPTVEVGHWDLEHELAQLLQDAAREETIPQEPVPADYGPHTGYGPAYEQGYEQGYDYGYAPGYDAAYEHGYDVGPDAGYGYAGAPAGFRPEPGPDPEAEPLSGPGSERERERERESGVAPHRRVRGPGHHRRVRRRITLAMVRTSISFAATASLFVIFVTVSLLSGLVTTGPLRTLVEPIVGDFAGWWPVLIQGPWVAAVLSILRTRTVRGTHALVAWAVLLLFSAVTVVLYVSQVPRNPIGVVIGTLPPVAALACLKLLTPHLVPAGARHAGAGTRTAPRKRGRRGRP